MVDSIQGMREIVAFGQGRARTGEMVANSWRFAHFQLQFLKERAFQIGFIEAMTALGGLVVITMGVWLLLRGDITRPELILAVILSIAAFAPVSDIARTMKELMETLAASRRVFAIHDEPVPVKDGQGIAVEGRQGTKEAPSIRFKEVSFSYGPGEPQALQDVTFNVDPGHTVALVGRSGAGKTTCANLLMRFWDSDDGHILLGDHDLRDYRLDDLRWQIALVSQDTYLFNVSVRENLRLGRPDASDTDVQEAARQANAHDFITAFPEGYDTRVGERGIQLSGGQRQRIAIARALLKNSPVLILDEATSHLDAVNEQQVREALDRLVEGRTTLIIAHRLSTVRDANNIVVLDDGKLVEQGNHHDLLASHGLYAQLVSTQLVSATSGPDHHAAGDHHPAHEDSPWHDITHNRHHHHH
jgi:ATP-binding cassette subfamily C protein CydCD